MCQPRSSLTVIPRRCQGVAVPADVPTARVCLVTGAGSGIGATIAARLSRHGHRVALCARTVDRLEFVAAGLPGPSLVVPADLTADGSVDEVFDAIEQAWGPVEILVANAGAGSSAPIVRITDGEWQRMLDLNLTAPFRCLRRALPAMTAAGWGRIVVVASVAANTWRAVHRGLHRSQARRAGPGPGDVRRGGDDRRDRQCRVPRIRRHSTDRCVRAGDRRCDRTYTGAGAGRSGGQAAASAGW